MSNMSSAVEFIQNCKNVVLVFCRYTAKFVRALIHYTLKGWWVVLICMAVAAAFTLYKHYTKTYPVWRVKGEVRFNGFNRITFQQELDNITFPVDSFAWEVLAGEVGDTYADSVPDFYNWNGQISITDINHHIMPDRAYLSYSTRAEDPFAPFYAMQHYFASKPYYQTVFEVMKNDLQEESFLLHKGAELANPAEIQAIYHHLSYVDDKLVHCTQPLVMVGDAAKIRQHFPSIGRQLCWPLIAGWLIGWLITLLFVNRKEVFGD